MAFFAWNDSLTVHVPEVDAQHKTLLGLLNGLHDAQKSGKSKEVMEKTLDGLAAYVLEHFSTEERLMARWNYPGLSDHKRRHQEFVGKVSGFIGEFKAGKAALSMDVKRFLCDWYQQHITQEDRKYSEFARSNRLV